MEKIILRNVRLSFPSLFKRAVFEGKETKFEATFLLPKSDEKTKALLDKAIESALTEAKVKVASDKRFMRDGDDSDKDGYEGNWSIKASSNRRVQIFDRDKTPIVEEDEILYAGCYVNAIISVWVQNNNFGKRVNANLLGVQFVKDGEPFGSGTVDVANDFDTLDDAGAEDFLS